MFRKNRIRQSLLTPVAKTFEEKLQYHVFDNTNYGIDDLEDLGEAKKKAITKEVVKLYEDKKIGNRLYMDLIQKIAIRHFYFLNLIEKRNLNMIILKNLEWKELAYDVEQRIPVKWSLKFRGQKFWITLDPKGYTVTDRHQVTYRGLDSFYTAALRATSRLQYATKGWSEDEERDYKNMLEKAYKKYMDIYRHIE